MISTPHLHFQCIYEIWLSWWPPVYLELLCDRNRLNDKLGWSLSREHKILRLSTVFNIREKRRSSYGAVPLIIYIFLLVFVRERGVVGVFRILGDSSSQDPQRGVRHISDFSLQR